MNRMPIDRFSRVSRVLLVLSVVLLASCRTYGGYGSEDATHEQITETNAAFGTALSSARAELPTLQRAAQGRPELTPYVGRYEALLLQHEEMAEAHMALQASLKVKTGALGRLTSSYRDLSRALGAIVSEQREIELAYEDIALDVRRAALGDAFVAEEPREKGRYQIVPPYYERLRYALERARIELDASVPG